MPRRRVRARLVRRGADSRRPARTGRTGGAGAVGSRPRRRGSSRVAAADSSSSVLSSASTASKNVISSRLVVGVRASAASTGLPGRASAGRWPRRSPGPGSAEPASQVAKGGLVPAELPPDPPGSRRSCRRRGIRARSGWPRWPDHPGRPARGRSRTPARTGDFGREQASTGSAPAPSGRVIVLASRPVSTGSAGWVLASGLSHRVFAVVRPTFVVSASTSKSRAGGDGRRGSRRPGSPGQRPPRRWSGPDRSGPRTGRCPYRPVCRTVVGGPPWGGSGNIISCRVWWRFVACAKSR